MNEQEQGSTVGPQGPSQGKIVRDWTFVSSSCSVRTRLARAESCLGLRPAPRSRALRVVNARPAGTHTFFFLPDGRLTPVSSLHRSPGSGLFAVASSQSVQLEHPELVPVDLLAECDAIY